VREGGETIQRLPRRVGRQRLHRQLGVGPHAFGFILGVGDFLPKRLRARELGVELQLEVAANTFVRRELRAQLLDRAADFLELGFDRGLRLGVSLGGELGLLARGVGLLARDVGLLACRLGLLAGGLGLPERCLGLVACAVGLLERRLSLFTRRFGLLSLGVGFLGLRVGLLFRFPRFRGVGLRCFGIPRRRVQVGTQGVGL
jgi:hypothetical protein